MKLLLPLAFLAAGMSNPPTHPSADRGAYDGFDIHEVEVVAVNYPRNFSVDVRDTVTGRVYGGVARSASCPGARKRLQVGQKYQAHFGVYLMEDQRLTLRLDEARLNQMLCPPLYSRAYLNAATSSRKP